MRRIRLSCLLVAPLIPFVMPGLARAYTTGCTPEEDGTTCYRASCSYSDIASAISAANAGDTIRISPGSCTFSNTLYVTKALHIIGAGSDRVRITDNDVANGTWDLNAPGLIRLSGFTIDGGPTGYGGTIRAHTDNNGWPCKDQAGRGPNQSSQPMYEWDNTHNGANGNYSINNFSGCSNPSVFDHVQDGRDYFTDTHMPGYSAYTYPHPLVKGPSRPSPPENLRTHGR